MSLLKLDWPAPACVHAYITTRVGGVSEAPYASFNLAAHVDDNAEHVVKNRALLQEHLGSLSSSELSMTWLNQVHGTEVIQLESLKNSILEVPTADGAYSHSVNTLCAVLTADCLPVLMCNKAGTEVAAVHAGWRGLANGILSKSLQSFSSPASEILVYLGPAISKAWFQVGEDVRMAFQEAAQKRCYAQNPIKFFEYDGIEQGVQKYKADLFALARSELEGAGVKGIYGGAQCTYANESLFYSYRREGQCGRFASLIYLSAKK